MTELTISEARKGLLTLPQRLAKTPDRTASITRHGKRVLAVMPWEFYESIVETLDVLSDPDMVSSLRESVDDVKHGRLISNEEARHRLGA